MQILDAVPQDGVQVSVISVYIINDPSSILHLLMLSTKITCGLKLGIICVLKCICVVQAR